MQTFTIPVVFMGTGYVDIQAESMEEALEKFNKDKKSCRIHDFNFNLDTMIKMDWKKRK